MTLSSIHRMCLKDAFQRLLGAPSEGTMAFVRSLAPEVAAELCAEPALAIDGWQIFGVLGPDHQGPNLIAADRAVDLREEKQGSILLLIDPKRAGAGIDGIYSAVREIGERELLDAARTLAQRRLKGAERASADEAVRHAKQLGRVNTISPWREFDFYACAAAEPAELGRHVARLGLWPIATSGAPSPDDCSLAAVLVDKLLLQGGASLTPAARVATLMLASEDRERAAELERFLRKGTGRRWSDTVEAAIAHPTLWLNNLVPGFNSEKLIAIELMPWRGKQRGGKPHAWSGLVDDEDGTPQLILDENDLARSRLEVRWRVLPKELKPGAAQYRVAIVTDSEHEIVARQVSHGAGEIQKCVFSGEDFNELEQPGKWEAKVVVHQLDHAPPGDQDDAPSPLWCESEGIVIAYGTREVAAKSGVGKKVRALIEETMRASPEEFEEGLRAPVTEDKQGYLGIRIGARSARTFRPPLVKQLEEDWRTRDYALGRWSVRARPDGTLVEQPRFEPLASALDSDDSRRRLEDATRALATRAMERGGFVGLIYRGLEAATTYVNAWIAALEAAAPVLALANTLEILSVAGERLGLLVLPSHPCRVAWHQAYDELAAHMRFEEGVKPTEALQLLSGLDGSFAPAFLPGLDEGESLVFGDMLGFHVVAMIRAGEPEPQAAVASLARCLGLGQPEVAPTVGGGTAEAIAREVEKYITLHSDYHTIAINALRPGDGRTVAKALGLAIKLGDEDGGPGQAAQPGYKLELYPAHSAGSRVLGRYFSETAARRRAGVGTLPAEDRWMLQSHQVEGATIPRLKWAKRQDLDQAHEAHLALAFDTFRTDVESCGRGEIGARPFSAFGLIPSIARSYVAEPQPTWTTTLAPASEGERHPAGRGLTDRLVKVQGAVMQAVARNLGGEWPVLRTRLTVDEALALRHMHDRSDWVITVDRNAGLEYFDAPASGEGVYETYVIDCVPERQDLDCIRLITSTSRVDEIRRLLSEALDEMALSCSPPNCRFLLSNLKAISGRLAMRLANRGHTCGELIALALFHANCVARAGESDWPSLGQGFLVPLDDVRDLLFDKGGEEPADPDGPEAGPKLRADLVYVDLAKRGTLRFRFIEIKYRRLQRTARDPQLHDRILAQTASTRARWFERYFAHGLTPSQVCLRRRKLARALHFYLEKAGRHGLPEEACKKLAVAIERLHRADCDVSSEPMDDLGFVFCPEYMGPAAEIGGDSRGRLLLFGPTGMPDNPAMYGARMDEAAPGALSAEAPDEEAGTASVADEPELPLSPASETSAIVTIKVPDIIVPPAPLPFPGARPGGAELEIVLGQSSAGAEVSWPVSIKGNPHLMIVGLPGMGKTTCIVNLCRQLVAGGITPIVFSYHEDIEEKLSSALGELQLTDLSNGLGFNPMRVLGAGVSAWLDNVGMLRDIFASLFPELGDLQISELREALKQSYTEAGYGGAATERGVPSFARFFEILKAKPKPNVGLLARLEELYDYGLFASGGALPSLLSGDRATIVRLYDTQNELVQNAMASFVLFNLYQNMFLRGTQPRLTHAVIFDEAHRANRLKLLPTMAKECRKYGLSFVVASQEARDFHPSLFAGIANYLVLHVNDADAKALAKNVVQSNEAASIAGRIKQLQKHTALFFHEASRPKFLSLIEG